MRSSPRWRRGRGGHSALNHLENPVKAPISLYHDADQSLLYTRYHGDLTHAGLDATVRELVAFAERTPTQRHLFDVTGVERHSIGASLVRVTAREALKILRRRREHRTAIVTTDRVLHALGIAFSWAAAAPTNEVRVFRDTAQAAEWLGVSLDAATAANLAVPET
jgi:hypothetical protein